MQLKELVQLPALSELKVVAGLDGLDNTVTNVNIMEVPDISDWVGDGQLVLTTLYPIKDDSSALHELLPMLHSRGASGLVIKLRRYVDEFPPYMIEQANRLCFPLIEMPAALSHPIVIEAVYSALAEKQVHALKLTQTAHIKMTETVANGGKEREICDLLANLFGDTVILADKQQRISICSEGNNAGTVSRDELLEAIRRIQFISSHNTGEQLLSTGATLIASPVFLGKWLQGEICMLSDSYVDIPVKRIVLGHAATMIAMLISHENELGEVERRYKNEFLHDWIYGKMNSDSTIRERAEQFGWSIKSSPVLLLVNAPDYISNPGLTLEERDKARKSVARIILNALRDNGIVSYIHDVSDNIKVLIPIKNSMSAEKLKAFTDETAELVYSSLLASGIDSYISSGNYYSSLSDLKSCFEEAAFAMRIGRKFNRQKHYFPYREQKLYGLLSKIDAPSAGYYIDKYYMPLIQYDKSRKAQLVETVKAYVKYHGNTSQISKSLFTHYNTIQYRLEKISDITGLNIGDADDCILLYLSIVMGEGELIDQSFL